jgi:hypothetical protein
METLQISILSIAFGYILSWLSVFIHFLLLLSGLLPFSFLGFPFQFYYPAQFDHGGGVMLEQQAFNMLFYMCISFLFLKSRNKTKK